VQSGSQLDGLPAAQGRMDGLRCRRCGRRCDAGDRFCRHCGTARSGGSVDRAAHATSAVDGVRARGRWRLGRWAAVAALAALLTLAAADEDIIEGVAKRIEIEATRQAAMGLEDAHAVEAQPKMIRVTCPDAPQVDVEDLGPDSQARNECLVFQVAAPDLDARLVVKCDGELDSDRSFYGDFV
jgi:hypothetical protein